jgi:hypothetical protein
VRIERRMRVAVGKTEGKRPLGRPSCSWVDNFFFIFEQPRTLLQLKLVGILTINLFLT